MRDLLLKSVNESIDAISQLSQPCALDFMEQTAVMLADAFKKGNKVIIAGNGGSLCDAAHFAEELTGFFRKQRPALPVIALSDGGHLTCIANDIGFEWVFSRGIEAYGKPNDIFIALTTSGNSVNIVNAVFEAKKRELKTIAFLGKGGGVLKGVADLELMIQRCQTSDRIQEVHMASLHMITEIVEFLLFPI